MIGEIPALRGTWLISLPTALHSIFKSFLYKHKLTHDYRRMCGHRYIISRFYTHQSVHPKISFIFHMTTGIKYHAVIQLACIVCLYHTLYSLACLLPHAHKIIKPPNRINWLRDLSLLETRKRSKLSLFSFSESNTIFSMGGSRHVWMEFDFFDKQIYLLKTWSFVCKDWI